MEKVSTVVGLRSARCNPPEWLHSKDITFLQIWAVLSIQISSDRARKVRQNFSDLEKWPQQFLLAKISYFWNTLNEPQPIDMCIKNNSVHHVFVNVKSKENLTQNPKAYHNSIDLFYLT